MPCSGSGVYPDQGERVQTLLEMTPEGPKRPKIRTPRQDQDRLDSVEIDQLIAQYRAGAKANELARQFKINRDTVFSILKRRGVKRHQRGLPPNQVQEAVDAYASGLSLANNAAEETKGCGGRSEPANRAV